MIRLKAAALAAALVLACAQHAVAQTPANFDRDVLGAIDTVPTRAQLDAEFPDARARLEAAALDDTRGTYARQRAITLLSLYPDARTRAFLEGLLAHVDPAVRRIAVYTLGRAFGQVADARLVATVAGVIERDPDGAGEMAVRALRWIAHEDARRVLTDVAAGPHPKLAKIAALAIRRAEKASATR